MTDILFWIIPPVIGAFIGYVTNLVAIKMLFRPLAEVRFFGLRLPFTPGLLPKQRHKLADNIGRMVEQELLTPGVLRERLARTEVRGRIENALFKYSGQLLERPLSYWLEDKSGEFPLAELSHNFVNSEVFDSFLEELIRIWLEKKFSLSGNSGKNDEKSAQFWVKSRFRDLGSMLIPSARDLIKSRLIREINNQDMGKNSSYRQALESIIEKYPGIKLGEFLSLGTAQKQQLNTLLSAKAIDALDENVDGVLSSVDVRVLVSDRINSLDMLRVEKIVLDVMAGQLKWINFFGAILGALIGFSQVLLSLFMR